MGTKWQDTFDVVVVGTGGSGLAATVTAGKTLMVEKLDRWGGSFILEDAVIFSVMERSMPGAIIVDTSGEQNVNKSTSYMDLGRKMLDRDAEVGGAAPSWMIMDGHFRKHYLLGMMPPGMTPSKFLKNGDMIKAGTIGELAQKCRVDAGNLKTVKRFNSFAHHGKDEDFGRGQDIYDRYYADPRVASNNNLAPIENAPFWATRIYPGDLGTKGGLLTDGFGRLLKQDGSVIEELYASGNNTASVMGKTYPGPGPTIGPACTFSFIAMNHLAGEL